MTESKYEDLIARLTDIVGALESGDLDLEKSLSSYEEGVRIVREAQGKLTAMEGRLAQLSQDATIPLPPHEEA